MNLRLKFSDQHGVTLVELMIVIAVAGILAAVASPTVFGAIRRERQKQVANDVANVFRKARNQAMARGEAFGVQIVADSQSGGTAGLLITERYIHQIPGAVAANLPPPGTCVDFEEDFTRNDCPPRTVCISGNCTRAPLRSCRDVYDPGQVLVTQLETLDLTPRANMGIREVSNVGPSFGRMCFDPDGSASLLTGGIAQAPATPTPCDSETFLLYLGDRGTSGDPLSWADYHSKMNCGDTAADYESVGGYVIRIGHNGEIGLRSPQ